MPSSRASLLPALLTVLLGAGCGGDDGGHTNDNQPPAILDRTEALTACVIADACGVMPFGYATICLTSNWDQQRITGTVPIWNSTYRCVLAADADCTAVKRCFALGLDPVPCADVSDGYCDGTVRAYCDTFDQLLYRQDCAEAYQTCAMSTVAEGVLAPACGQGTCDPATDVATCLGDAIVSCDQGVWMQSDCAPLGLVCGDGRFGGKACVGAGAACNENTYASTCIQGSVLNTCVQNHVAIIDCSQRPGVQVCEPVTGTCVTAGTECTTGQEACQGALMHLCVDGSVLTLDCAALGFTRCEVSNGGAHCRL
jgi:hypothetical protein